MGLRDRLDRAVTDAVERLPHADEVDSWPLHQVILTGAKAIGLVTAKGTLLVWKQGEDAIKSFNDARRASRKDS